MKACCDTDSPKKTPQGVPDAYIPALRFHWLTRLYDFVLKITLREKYLKQRLAKQASIESGQRVLDLGCGTATLTLLLKRMHPDAEVVGLDGDKNVLAIARRKVIADGLNVDLMEGFAETPPFEARSFDRIVSCLLFHHLSTLQKQQALAKARELLRSGGQLHIADWGKAGNPLMRAAFLSIQLLDGFRTTADNIRGRIPELMREAGFDDVKETHRATTIYGTLSFYRGIVRKE